jgi:endonuclease/exonuclease/phosphatase family metal-dependent hydrolase
MIKHVVLAPVFCLLAGLPAYAQYSGSPYLGNPVQLPGTVYAANFDNGGEGVAYHDTDWINWGGQYRDTGVDIQWASDGGYDIGWFDAGEWLNYTVNVASAGSYTITARVASPYGGNLHVGFNGASSVWQQVWVPNTGDWQNWTTVSFTATLGAGWQQITLMSDTGGFNVESVSVASGDFNGPCCGSGGTLLPVAEWNIQINDNSEWHARVAMDNLLASGPRPEVIVIVEAYSNLFYTYIDELQAQTGQTWYGAFATHCASGDWNGGGCNNTWYQGVGIFSTHWISDTSSTLFPYADCWTSARAGLRAQIDVNGLPVQVFATHLQTGGCANDAQSRSNSMQDLKRWAGNYSAPQLAAGDFNADPDQIDTTWGMAPNFVDSWFVAGTGSRFTAFVPDPSMKIDYWFSDASGRATAQTSSVNTSAWWVSDHLPLQATFLVK